MAHRFLLLLLLTACSTMQVLAQNANKNPDPLERFAKQIGTYSSLSATLKLSIMNRQSQFEQIVDASLEMRGKAYCFLTEELEIWSDGTTTWQYMPVLREVTITEVDSTAFTLFDNVMRLFSEYGTLYKVAYKGEVVEQGARNHLYHLYPKDLGQPYSQIHILLKEKGGKPSSIYYKGKDGVDYKVDIRTFTPNATVRKSFAFQPKGKRKVKIVDLRGL